MAPAKTAVEWLQRLKKDYTTDHYRSDLISRLYSELPPLDQWPAINTQLKEITKDSAAFENFSEGRQPNFHNNGLLQLKLFANLLTEDSTNAEITYRELLQKEPSISYYEYDRTLNNLLLLSGNTEESLAWYKANITKHDNHSSSYSKDKKTPSEKALAANRIDEGIKLLIEEIDSAEIANKASLISKLAKIAYLLDKPKLGEQAMIMLETIIIDCKKNGKHLSSYSYTGSLDYLIQTSQYQRAIDLCDKFQATEAEKKSNRFSSSTFDLNEQKLTALHKLGKTELFEREINKLFEKHKKNPKTFFNILDEKVASEPTIGSFYIELLTNKPEAKNKQKAFNICAHLLARNQGTDAYYKQLIALDPKAATALIASLRVYDPFEERPLIWQAEMALSAGNIDEAETLINQAIALDPSDGDHGKFTRMHCYDVLARICTLQGNTEKATFLNEVVISIRQGEAADDYLYAGLTQEATERYKKALGHFNDAYCLQSRLAKTLMESGKFDEAIPHFKKAFELMPISFGPRESHCFGCEGLFDDVRVQNLALPLLKAFLEKEPENPRTPYLLGLLFEDMKKTPEAIAAYQKAIEIDPQYYNAGKRLIKLLKKDPTNFAKTQALNKKLFEIAPYANKPEYITTPHLLKTYWQAAENFPPSPITIAPISELGFTSTSLSDKQYKKVKSNSHSYSSYYSSSAALDGWSPKELLRKNKFINDAIE